MDHPGSDVFPQTELAMRSSGGFLGTGGCLAPLPGPEVTKKVAVVRVWRSFGVKRWLWLENGGCPCPVLEPQPLFFVLKICTVLEPQPLFFQK